MDYQKLIEMIPNEKRQALAEKLADCILVSKNDEKMPASLAHNILHHWQENTLETENGLPALLEAAVMLEPDKTVNALNELQITNVAEQIKETIKTQG